MSDKRTKLSVAREIVQANPDKKQAIAAIMEELGVTKANAFVYWTKSQDLEFKPEKVRKVNPITETTPAQAAVKIAEIDSVIAGLRAQGAVSPFPVAA